MENHFECKNISTGKRQTSDYFKDLLLLQLSVSISQKMQNSCFTAPPTTLNQENKDLFFLISKVN